MSVCRASCIAAALLLFGCHAGRPLLAHLGGNATVDLAEDDDRHDARDHFDAMRLDDPKREALRNALSVAAARAVDDELIDQRLDMARDELLVWLSMWRHDIDHAGAGLAPYAPTLRRARAAFAKSGADASALAALAALATASPADASKAHHEIDEIIEYLSALPTGSDEAAPVASLVVPALEPAATHLPAAWLVSEYLELITARQHDLADRIAKEGASFTLVRRFRDVIDSSRRVASVLALADRPGEIADRLATMKGIGTEPTLLTGARALELGAPGWTALAAELAGGRSGHSADLSAALAIATAGADRFRDNAPIAAAAASYADALGRGRLAARYATLARDRNPDDATLRDVWLRMTARQLRTDAATARFADVEASRAAFARALTAEGISASARESWRAHADVAIAAGLLEQGAVDDADQLLRGAVAIDPSPSAFRWLGVVHEGRDEAADALDDFEHAIHGSADPSADDIDGKFELAVLHRLAGEAALRVGKRDLAGTHFMAAISIWADLAEKFKPEDEDKRASTPHGHRSPAAEGARFVETGRALWRVDEHDKARSLFAAATTVDDHGGQTYRDVVAFLLLADDVAGALDMYHRALAAPGLADDTKIYLSLWCLADQRRRGLPDDPLAIDYVRRRHGARWTDALAAMATGKLGAAALKKRAHRPRQRAEAAYYLAVFGNGGTALLAEVVRDGVFMSYEFDDAKRRLAGSAR